jgi:hypothetical protein
MGKTAEARAMLTKGLAIDPANQLIQKKLAGLGAY